MTRPSRPDTGDARTNRGPAVRLVAIETSDVRGVARRRRDNVVPRHQALRRGLARAGAFRSAGAAFPTDGMVTRSAGPRKNRLGAAREVLSSSPCEFRLPRGGDRGVRQLTKPTIRDTLESNRPYPVNGVVGRSDHESDPHLDR